MIKQQVYAVYASYHYYNDAGIFYAMLKHLDPEKNYLQEKSIFI